MSYSIRPEQINGENVSSEVDFHIELSKKLNFPSYYGKNLDALWDILSSDVERPIILIWKNASISKEKMGGSMIKYVMF